MEGNLLAHSSGHFGYLWVSLGEENYTGFDITPFYNAAGSVPKDKKEGKLTPWTDPTPDI